MPRLLTILRLAAVLFLAVPAQAQLRANVPSQSGTAAVYQSQTGFSLRSLINPDHFKIGQSYEMSFSSFGGQSLGLGVYTTSLQFQPNDKLAARVDVGVAHSPFGSEGVQQSLGVMVNYRYEPDEIEVNHEAFVKEGRIVAAPRVHRLQRGRSGASRDLVAG